VKTQIEELAALLRRHPALVLSGAGISTDSGIPDYRSPAALARRREPMRYQEFSRSEEARKRYWARSHAGWLQMRMVGPNAAHWAVARLERAGCLTGVLTQNVDGLHQRAGSSNVLELHGSIARVRCLDCDALEPMASVQGRMAAMNPDFLALAARLNPDGDAELPDGEAAGFRVPTCLSCGGRLKTDVVFFGENVPAAVVERAWQMLTDAGSLLVVGSSLTVRSGYRFVEAAAAQGKEIAIVNRGVTKGDGLAAIRIDAPLGAVLPELQRKLLD